MNNRDLLIFAWIISIVLIVMCCAMIFICFELVEFNDTFQTFKHNFDSFSSSLMNK